MWTPHPDSVQTFRARGVAGQDMATIADDTTNPRFGLEEPFVLVQIRVWFSGGSSSALLSLYQWIADQRSGKFDQKIRDFPAAGTDDDEFKHFRVQADEYPSWKWLGGDMLVPVWANPNTQEWQFEISLAPIAGGLV